VKVHVQAKTKEVIAAGNYSNLDFIFPEYVGGTTAGWNSVYYTFDPFTPMKKEMFFQRADIVRHSSLEFLSSTKPKPESTYLQYHHEYNRWERHVPLNDLLAQDTITVATIHLRATSSRIIYDERQVKTLYDFPKDVGGFWTAILFISAVCYTVLQRLFPARVVNFSELFHREMRKAGLNKEGPCANHPDKAAAPEFPQTESWKLTLPDETCSLSTADSELKEETSEEVECYHTQSGDASMRMASDKEPSRYQEL